MPEVTVSQQSAQPPLSDAELVEVRKMLATGGVIGNVQAFIENNPKVMIFFATIISGLIAWMTHGAVNPPLPARTVVIDAKKVVPGVLTDEQKKAIEDAVKGAK